MSLLGKLLSNRKTVVGIFDEDANVEQAIEGLQALGYGLKSDDISIIDQHQLDPEVPENFGVGIQPISTGGQVYPAAVPTVQAQPESGNYEPTLHTVRRLEETLVDAGVGDEEADFFAQRVIHGAKLVVVQVKPDDVPAVEQIFEEAGQAQVKTA
ncbi:MAG: hypothetical protein KDI79_28925 [Anaerolineae bacterium]|nr:hypothetical protein [Anaerolineae bacterium]